MQSHAVSKAAITLYVDIIQLFLYLLQLFGDRND